ncbi:MAG: META domain-containing protein [Burkholderiaceae bacterium]
MPQSIHPAAPRLRRPWFWAAPALALSLAACAAGGTQTASLQGTEWRLVEMDGQPVPERPAATLFFKEPGQVTGSGSCNRFFGKVTLSGDQIGFGQMGSTKMACAGPAAQLEPRYLTALHHATRYELKGAELLIHLKAPQAPLRFARTQP